MMRSIINRFKNKTMLLWLLVMSNLSSEVSHGTVAGILSLSHFESYLDYFYLYKAKFEGAEVTGKALCCKLYCRFQLNYHGNAFPQCFIKLLLKETKMKSCISRKTRFLRKANN